MLKIGSAVPKYPQTTTLNGLDHEKGTTTPLFENKTMDKLNQPDNLPKIDENTNTVSTCAKKRFC
jgi:hypothetical protein